MKNYILTEAGGDRDNIPNVIVLLVDSHDRTEDVDTLEAAEDLKTSGSQVKEF